MPRRRSRTEIRRAERENAATLGDDYRFTNDQEMAAQRRENRRQRAKGNLEAYKAYHHDRWTKCMVPGCKFTVPKLLDFTHGIAIAICTVHQVAVWEHVNDTLDEPDVDQTRAAMRARRDAIRLAEEDVREAEAELARQQKRDLDAPGDVYYVRVGDLIKVGWTSDLYARVRSYGPGAELLVHFKGTRRDETNLHRNLVPSRAKGREWYHEDAVVQAFITNALRQHGEPRFTHTRWTEAKPVVAGKRVNRSA